MKKLLLLFYVFILFSSGLSIRAQEQRSITIDEVIADFVQKVNADSIEYYIQTLEDFGTRFCLANNRKEVAEWIKAKFISLGYPDTRLDSFQLNRWYNGVYYQTWQYNVIATYQGYLNPDQIYVMGGHYDAIVPASSNPFVIAPGADDNASGVAAAFEVARIMKQFNYQPESTIKFIAFAAEELGLHGSWNYANKAANQNMNIAFMLNNDMISYCTLPQSQWTLRIQKYPNSLWVTNLATYIAQTFTVLNVTEGTQYIQYSDSWPFYSNGYNAIFLQENQFTPYYHTVNDLVVHSNMPYTAEMVKVSLGMLIHENGIGSIAGSTCNSPYVANLPLIDFEGNTEIYGNNISPEWIVTTPSYASNYIGGNEMVFEFSISENSILSGSVSCLEGNNAGLFIIDDCPGPFNSVQVLKVVGGTTGGSFEQLPLPAGIYYAIVSNWPDPEFTSFTLNLSSQPAPQQAEIAITPDEIDFGTVNIGNQSPHHEFVIRNIGNEELLINTVSVTGENPDQFVIIEHPGFLPLALQFGETLHVSVAFAPSLEGPQSAYFTVTDNTSATHNKPIFGIGETLPLLLGDANCDGVVDVLDVIAIVNYIFGNTPSPFCFENADATQNGVVDVLDVIATVNIITGNTKSHQLAIKSGKAHLSLSPGNIALRSDGTLTGLQFEITGEYLNYMNLRLELPGFEFAYQIEDNKLLGLIFSFNNEPIPAGNTELVSFEGDHRDLQWGEVIAGNVKAERVHVTKLIENVPANITSDDYELLAFPNPAQNEFVVEVFIPYQSEASIRIFDMVGREMLKLHHGNIAEGAHRFNIKTGHELGTGFYLLHIQAKPFGAAETLINKNLKLIIQ